MSGDFKIMQDENGHWIASRDDLTVAVVGKDGQLFHRRAVKLQGGQETRESMLVARLNGVSVYLRDGEIVVTDKDIYL
jgi:hypothetical protein